MGTNLFKESEDCIYVQGKADKLCVTDFRLATLFSLMFMDPFLRRPVGRVEPSNAHDRDGTIRVFALTTTLPLPTHTRKASYVPLVYSLTPKLFYC